MKKAVIQIVLASSTQAIDIDLDDIVGSNKAGQLCNTSTPGTGCAEGLRCHIGGTVTVAGGGVSAAYTAATAATAGVKGVASTLSTAASSAASTAAKAATSATSTAKTAANALKSNFDDAKKEYDDAVKAFNDNKALEPTA